MSSYRKIFPNRHTFLVVIHVEERNQAFRNIEIAQACAADGVFLINHAMTPKELLHIYEMARIWFPSIWMGLNLLGLDARQAIAMLPDRDVGVWVDDAGIRNSGDCTEAREIQRDRLLLDSWDGLYFGGVAFKHQEAISNPAAAARRAMPFMDVITTSGDATGIAADVEKIRAMKEAVGDHPLAIASGITPENIHQYLPYADCFLVATGISYSHTELNRDRVRSLADAMRQ